MPSNSCSTSREVKRSDELRGLAMTVLWSSSVGVVVLET